MNKNLNEDTTLTLKNKSFSEKINKELTRLRREIHRHPELSNQEKETAQRLQNWLKQFNPDQIITGIGGHGFVAIFEGKEKGKTLLFRTELDALPIEEDNDFEHRSVNKGVSHKCGHDGHMAMVAGIAPMIAEHGLKKGRVMLLFQPAEETGEGADRMLKDEKFKEIKPDAAFALHNLPGLPQGQVVVKKGVFAAASKGMIIKLKGATAHAAEPHNGNSPAPALAKIIQRLIHLSNHRQEEFKDFILITVIHARLGEVAFGTTPGYAEIMATLRSYENEDMGTLTREAEKIAKEAAGEYKLKADISYTEEFPATESDEQHVELLKEIAAENNFDVKEVSEPFRWSEDFGYFSEKFSGAFFGIGSGTGHAQLHNSDYDFPDEIIEVGVKMYWGICRKILNPPAGRAGF